MSDFETDHDVTETLPPIHELTRAQRRVLGTLVEKAFTVPESYPMTLKGLTVGCNQKSNRDPVTSYTEDSVLDALDELRRMGLVAVVHTESGRTERYRHYTRKRFPFTEPQLAIVTELLLRGRQQLGELRARVSRMVPIESLEDLRKELESLCAQNYLHASGSLDRRGVEIDHAFYPSEEAAGRAALSPADDSPSAGRSREDEMFSRSPAVSAASRPETRDGLLEELRTRHQELETELQDLRQQLELVKDDLAQLRQSLGA